MIIKPISESASNHGIIMGIPSIEGGHFTQEVVGLDQTVALGEIALISGVNPKDIDLIADGQNVVEDLYLNYDPAKLKRGVYEFEWGKVSLVANSKANQLIADDAVIRLSQFGLRAIREFAPYAVPIPHHLSV
jgi:hypothetical protein